MQHRLKRRVSPVACSVSRCFSHSEDARYKAFGRCTVVEIFVTESLNEDFFFNMDPVEKSHKYWDKNYQQAQVVRKVESKAEERKQTACVCRMANKAIDSPFDHSVVFSYRHIYGELMLQGKDGEPANNQSKDDESDANNGKDPGSKFNVSDLLNADKNAQVYGYEDSDPQFAN